MTGLDAVVLRAEQVQLEILGGFHPDPGDGVPDGIGTLFLLGPREPGFWPMMTATREFKDGAPNAIDRWSRRVIGQMACDLGGKAYFPFSGPPWHPFIRWAHRSGHAWASEVGILIHDRAGLMVAYRGALGLRDRITLPPPGTRPCDSCRDKPCLTACPVDALKPQGYDVPACKSHLDTEQGRATCMAAGCLVRRVCPVSRNYGRDPAQSAYHMRYFHR